MPMELNQDTLSKDIRSDLGREGEDLAAHFLERKGYRLVVSNFRVPIGRNRKGVQVTGEIDLVALDGGVLCFTEVKARSSEDFTPAISAIDVRKQRQIVRAARAYRRIFDLTGIDYRYDVITVVKAGGEAARIEHIRGFWTEEKFRKRAWSDEFSR
jgi:putative endonuclease